MSAQERPAAPQTSEELAALMLRPSKGTTRLPVTHTRRGDDDALARWFAGLPPLVEDTDED